MPPLRPPSHDSLESEPECPQVLYPQSGSPNGVDEAGLVEDRHAPAGVETGGGSHVVTEAGLAQLDPAAALPEGVGERVLDVPAEAAVAPSFSRSHDGHRRCTVLVEPGVHPRGHGSPVPPRLSDQTA